MRALSCVLAAQICLAGFVSASAERPSVIGHISVEDDSGVTTPGKAILLNAPAPGYPYIARKNHWEGAGIFVMHINPETGVVRSVTIEKSTGHVLLDRAAIEGFSKWKYKVPLKCKKNLRCPIRYFMPKQPEAAGSAKS